MIELCEHGNYHCSICEVKFLKLTIDELHQQNKKLIGTIERIQNYTNEQRGAKVPDSLWHMWIGKMCETALQQTQGKEEER